MLTANGMPSHHLTYLGSIFFEAVTCSKSRVHGKSSSQSLVAADAKAAKSAVQSRFIIASLKKKARESPACFGGSWTMPLMSHNIVAIKRSEYLDNWWNILMTKWKPPKHKEIIGIGRLGRFVKFLPISIRRRSTTKPTKIYCSFKGSGMYFFKREIYLILIHAVKFPTFHTY